MHFFMEIYKLYLKILGSFDLGALKKERQRFSCSGADSVVEVELQHRHHQPDHLRQRVVVIIQLIVRS